MAQRREFIDWARGVAVVAMVVWHTADGWLAPDARSGQSWAVLRFVGGLAAPTFLFLAGTAAALSARGEPEQRRDLARDLARGLEIMLLGYALRFQTWLIDASAVTQLHLMRAWLPLGLGYALLFASLRSIGRPTSRARLLALAGALACVVGFVQVPALAPGRLPRLLQVDVLQAIGASLILLALAERQARLLQRPMLALALGAFVACLPEPIYTLLPGPLPVPLAAYLGKFAVGPGAPAPALFPLFPWFAYACVGAAVGTRLRIDAEHTPRIVVNCALAGAVLGLSTSESHDFVQRAIASQPGLVHPLRVAFRIGLVAVLLCVGWLWAEQGRGRALIAYGRASLRVYWAHLLVAYGVLGSAWHKRLHMGEWAALVALLLVAMWLLAKARHRSRVPRDAEASK